MPATLPTTPPPGPPNLYAQAGQMAAAQGGSTSTAQAPPGQAQTNPSDQEFFDNITKLLAILDKLSTMKPMGQDVSKYITAAAAPLKNMMQVFKQPDGAMPGQTPADGSVADSSSAGGAAAPPGPDTGAS